MRTLLAAAALPLSLSLGATSCSRPDADENRAPERAKAAFAARDTGLQLATGDIRIVNTDSSVELALIGSRIMMRLSDKTVGEIKRQTDTSTVSGSGIGASIEKMVKSGVASALNQQVEYPLSEVRDARYEDGEIKLDMTGDRPRIFAQTRVNRTPVMKSFRPSDAEAFVAAVKARKQNQ
jgi:hypothetical protein